MGAGWSVVVRKGIENLTPETSKQAAPTDK